MLAYTSPTDASHSVIGLISIPGMMTGAILGGSSVEQAARLQSKLIPFHSPDRKLIQPSSDYNVHDLIFHCTRLNRFCRVGNVHRSRCRTQNTLGADRRRETCGMEIERSCYWERSSWGAEGLGTDQTCFRWDRGTGTTPGTRLMLFPRADDATTTEIGSDDRDPCIQTRNLAIF